MVTSSSHSVFFAYATCFLLVYSLFFSCVKTEVKNNLCQSWQYNLLATRKELDNRKASVKTQELMVHALNQVVALLLAVPILGLDRLHGQPLHL